MLIFVHVKSYHTLNNQPILYIMKHHILLVNCTLCTNKRTKSTTIVGQTRQHSGDRDEEPVCDYLVDSVTAPPAHGKLQVGDWIRSVNHEPIQQYSVRCLLTLKLKQLIKFYLCLSDEKTMIGLLYIYLVSMPEEVKYSLHGLNL